MAFRTVDPSNGETIREHAFHGEAEIAARLDAARAAFERWRRLAVEERTPALKRLAALLRSGAEPHAELMAREMGKPLAQGRAEIEKCAWVCEHYAETAAAGLADELVETEASKSFVSYRPLGVVLAIMPWNFPYWQAIRMAAPTLAAGNAILLKHAEVTTGCCLALEELFAEAGFPEGLLQSLLVDHERIAELIPSDAVDAVTLTGSTRAGRAVGELCGRAVKSVVLELGGSDPYLVLEDADLEQAVEACVTARLINSGQTCIAAKRWIVVDAVRERFTGLALEALRSKRVGDPRDDDTDIGPMARIDLRDELHSQVERSVAAGARLLLGGEKPEGPGAWYPVSLLDGVAPGMPAWDEELFGPVAAIVPARDEADAIRIANGTRYGLGAAVFTQDLARGERIARDELVAGACFVNDFVKSDPRLPFGGVKESGLGRELGPQGLRELTNTKTVVIR